jgi:hypothetical protein
MGETDVTLTPSPQPRRHRLFTRHRDSAQIALPLGGGVQRHALLSTTVYRLSLPGQPERSSPDLHLDGNPYTRLRLEARHSTQEWGATPPQLSIGTRSREIILLARDANNANLSWGDPKATGIPMPLAQLMPLGADQAVGSGSVNMPAAAQSPGPAPKPQPVGQSETAAKVAPASQHTPWLWAALVGGLLLLAGMAYSLLKGMKASRDL